MSLQKDIRKEMQESMKERNALKTSVLRGVLSAFVNELVIQKRKPDEELSDGDAVTVIKRLTKQRNESIEQFEAGGRDDLVSKEKDELIILEKYLPETMGKDEIKKIAQEKKAELNITDKAKAGILIGALMKDLSGKADGKDVKEVVESLFV